ncbi:hypothetical protein [Caulobacter rhizosphaerae]|uniref:hypothetical protein n=1 Tax=Caulobacter rhizosphaerae TaxID=2010972 RepID=UPI0013D42BED|nr:hypothetical protein [Caulobacter rhizosphaerae]
MVEKKKPGRKARAADQVLTQGDGALTPNELTLLAMGTVLVEMMRAVEDLAPGRFDRMLQLDRLRLQQLEAGRVDRAFAFEDEILRKRIELFERGQDRPPTQT